MRAERAKAEMAAYFDRTVRAERRQRAETQARLHRLLLCCNGRPYRVVMRLVHRFGFCWPQPTCVEPDHVWCHWCGMRGRS